MMQEIAHYAIPVYAVLMLLGGIMGFVKGRSKASLIAGAGSALALGGCFAYSYSDLKIALGGAFVLALVLESVFAMRLAKTKKFMPAGVLLIISGIFQVIFILGIV
jgi:uncharacterized membrane protein (UPF0136 family)